MIVAGPRVLGWRGARASQRTVMAAIARDEAEPATSKAVPLRTMRVVELGAFALRADATAHVTRDDAVLFAVLDV